MRANPTLTEFRSSRGSSRSSPPLHLPQGQNKAEAGLFLNCFKDENRKRWELKTREGSILLSTFPTVAGLGRGAPGRAVDRFGVLEFAENLTKGGGRHRSLESRCCQWHPGQREGTPKGPTPSRGRRAADVVGQWVEGWWEDDF